MQSRHVQVSRLRPREAPLFQQLLSLPWLDGLLHRWLCPCRHKAYVNILELHQRITEACRGIMKCVGRLIRTLSAGGTAAPHFAGNHVVRCE